MTPVHGREGMLKDMRDNLSPASIVSKKKLELSCFLFTQSGTLVHRKTPPAFKVGISISTNIMEEPIHRHSQRFMSMVLSNYVKLAINNDDYKSH